MNPNDFPRRKSRRKEGNRGVHVTPRIEWKAPARVWESRRGFHQERALSRRGKISNSFFPLWRKRDSSRAAVNRSVRGENAKRKRAWGCLYPILGTYVRIYGLAFFATCKKWDGPWKLFWFSSGRREASWVGGERYETTRENDLFGFLVDLSSEGGEIKAGVFWWCTFSREIGDLFFFVLRLLILECGCNFSSFDDGVE